MGGWADPAQTHLGTACRSVEAVVSTACREALALRYAPNFGQAAELAASATAKPREGRILLGDSPLLL